MPPFGKVSGEAVPEPGRGSPGRRPARSLHFLGPQGPRGCGWHRPCPPAAGPSGAGRPAPPRNSARFTAGSAAPGSSRGSTPPGRPGSMMRSQGRHNGHERNTSCHWPRAGVCRCRGDPGGGTRGGLLCRAGRVLGEVGGSGGPAGRWLMRLLIPDPRPLRQGPVTQVLVERAWAGQGPRLAAGGAGRGWAAGGTNAHGGEEALRRRQSRREALGPKQRQK